ncbi:flagellar motor switch protein FliM [Ruegeria marisrubri]|nr:FliM/FliN family flagellar motor switch protein [Ruegeria marisrubri]
MTTEVETRTVLARKLRLERDRTEESPRSLLRALRLGLARGASEVMNLKASVIGARQSCREQDDLPQVLADGQLYLVLSSPEGARAAACIDPDCVCAIIQQQTTGQVTPGQTESRKYTETDAAMVAPLLEGALSRALDLVEAAEDRCCLSGLEYVARVDDPRGVSLVLDQERYRVCDLTVDFAGGQRQGSITLVLPECAAPEAPQADPVSSRPRRLDQASAVIRAELTAVIAQLQIPLSALSELGVGDRLPLSGNSLGRVRLLTIEGHAVSTGQLGQCDGMRAVRLRENPPELGATRSISGSFRQLEAATTDKDAPSAVANADVPAGRDGVPDANASRSSGVSIPTGTDLQAPGPAPATDSSAGAEQADAENAAGDPG